MRGPLLLLLLPGLIAACADEKSSGGDGPSRDAGVDATGSGGRSGTGGAAATGGRAAGGAGTGGATGGAGGAGGAADAGTDAPEDGSPDAGDAADAALPYCPLTDFVPRTCGDDGACGDGEECLRGVCLRTCGTPLDDLAALLGDAVIPVATICNARAGLVVTRSRQDGDCTRVDVLGYRTYGSGVADEVGWTFRSYEVDPFQVSPAPGTNRTGTFISPGGSPFFQTAPTLSPSGTRLGSLLYYNTGAPNPMVVATDPAAVTVGGTLTASSSFYGSDWLDDDRWLVVEGTDAARALAVDPAPGGATVPVLTGLGDGRGAVSVRALRDAGVTLVVVGGTLHVVPLARLLAVANGDEPSPIDAATDPDVQRISGPFDAFVHVIGETELATAGGSFGDPLEVRRLVFTGTTLSLGAPRMLATNAQAVEGAAALTGDLVYVPHFSRALVARWAP